jgi:dihydrofolate synthase/folylpolyglutamate synthase
VTSQPGDAVYEAAVGALFARRPEVMLPGLDRIRALSARLGDPQRAYPAVHITGTNGKTSIARMVTGVLEALGLLTGTYTSPHLHDVRERIRVGGRPVSPTAFVGRLDALAPHIAAVEAERGEMVTFFETLTALASACFAGAGVDVGVVEVGMGGRWDATNLVDGRVAVLGRVGLDHAELGSTVAEVAAEKAGIIKDGAAVVSAAQEPAAARVIARAAAAHGASILWEGRDFGLRSRRPTPDGQDLVLWAGEGAEATVHLPLHGAHQAANAACAFAAVVAHVPRAARDAEAVRTGFAAARSPGRLELFHRPGRAPVLLDGAHNPDGARALAAALRGEFPFRRRVVVLGVMGDKDVDGIVGEVLGAADAVVVTQPASNRAAPADRLAKAVRLAGRTALTAVDVPAALALASELAGEDDAVVVVTGSLYTVGEAREIVGRDAGRLDGRPRHGGTGSRA